MLFGLASCQGSGDMYGLVFLTFVVDECVDREGKSDDIFQECLKKFITNAISLHKEPFHTFGLINVPFPGSWPDTNLLLPCLSRNEIRELGLSPACSNGILFPMPSSLYYCQKLAHLVLGQCELPPPPLAFKGFSCLRSIILYEVKVSSDDLRSLVVDSPLLESFTWRDYDSQLEFIISAPKLECFTLSAGFKEISLYAPVVARVSVGLLEDHFTAEQLQNSSVCNYTKFLGGFTNLEWFMAANFFPKYLSIGIEYYDRSLVFHQLKFIHVSEVSFEDMKEISVIVHLIMGAPNLHELQIIITEDEAPPIPLENFGYSPDCTIEKLRVVEMNHIQPNAMDFIKFLLKSSPVLETMTLCFSSELLPLEMLNLTTELLSYSGASPNVKIETAYPLYEDE